MVGIAVYMYCLWCTICEQLNTLFYTISPDVARSANFKVKINKNTRYFGSYAKRVGK
jgi:hypothetical protein